MDTKSKRNIQPFNGEKYSVWKFRIKSLLAELQVLDVIDEAVPENPSAQWIKRNQTAKNTIVEYLSDTYLNFAKDQNRAQEILRELDSICEVRV